MYAPHHYDNLARDTEAEEDRREAYKASMMRDEVDDARCTRCNDDYAQTLDGLCNECEDYRDGRLLGYQTPHDEEES